MVRRPVPSRSTSGAAELPVPQCRADLPVTRWIAVAQRGVPYCFWQHERLGWWAWSPAFAQDGRDPRWRPIVAPLMLVVDREGLTLTFTDWPATHLEQHDWFHDVGPIARLRVNPRRGWPGDPPVARLLAGTA